MLSPDDALLEKAATQSIRAIADSCGIDYRKLLMFSQGSPPTFDVLDLDRLADCLGLRLTYEVLEPDSVKPTKARAKAR